MKYLRERILEPIAIPVVAVAFIAFGALNLSRLFLAASHADRAVLVAAAAAILILGGAVWATSKERIDRGMLLGGAAMLGIVLSGAGLIAQQVDLDREAEAEGGGGEAGGGFTSAVEIVAVDIDFPEKQVQAADGGGIEFTLKNDGAAQHTFVFEGLEDEFKLDAGGGGTDTAVFKMDPGEYVFYCDVPGHRAAGMEGTLTVTEGGGAAAGGAEGGGAAAGPPVKVVAQDIKFPESRYEAKAGTIAFEYPNEGAALHTLVVEGHEDEMKLEANGGETDSGTIELEPGTYVLYCDVPGHRAAGMEAELVLS